MFTALRATSITLARYLEKRLKTTTDLGGGFTSGTLEVTLNTPREMQRRQIEGLSVWLYRVIRDDLRSNVPPVRVSESEYRQPPLPLRLYYLMTPITGQTEGATPEMEQLILGRLLQVFHTYPVLRGMDLQDDFIGAALELQVRLEPMGLEEITRIWDALKESYQLSVSYEVSVVYIESGSETEQITPVDTVIPEYAITVSSET